MNFKSLLLCFSLFTFPFSLVSAQQHKVDSLLKVLDNTKEDTARLRLYLALGDACDLKDNLKYAEPALQLCDKLLAQTTDEKRKEKLLKDELAACNLFAVYYDNMQDTSGAAIKIFEKQFNVYRELHDTANMINFILQGCYYMGNRGAFQKSVDYCNKGLELARQMNYTTGIASCLFVMAELYSGHNENDLALQNLQKCIAIDSLAKDPLHNYLKRDYLKIGSIYSAMHDTTKALNYYRRAMAIIDTNKQAYTVELYLGLGRVYRENNDISNAIRYYQRLIAFGERAHNKFWMSLGLNNLAYAYLKEAGSMKKIGQITAIDSVLKLALNYFNKSLPIGEELRAMGQNNDVSSTYTGLTRVYFNLKDYKQAEYYNDKCLQLELAVQNMEKGELYAAQIDSAMGNYKEAYQHYQKYVFLNNKMNDETIRKAATQQKYQDEYDKQKAEQDKKDAAAEAEKKKQRIISASIAGGLILALIFGGFVVRSLRITRKQKGVIEVKSKELEEKNKDILDSIAYAKRLQDAILPPLSLVKQYLPESFLLYKPKDIVAGDFYWMERAGDVIFIAAADCTGHGVPGAMVSVVCSNALNRTVKEFKITEPGKILDKVRELVLETFEKSEDNVQDGMDISLCCINTKTKEIQWSGAYNSLWYVHKGEMKELPADKQPIGKTDNPKPFTTHTLSLPLAIGTHSSLYLFTDGYADQFGGPKGKKFKYKQLQEKLSAISSQPMEEQKKILEQTLEEWRGGLEQVDDILIIGIRI